MTASLVAQCYNKALKKYATGKLLDLGCGRVPLYLAYKDYITENICVDWENTLHKNKYLDYECDLTKPLPFKNGEFNTIILSDVLEHIPNPDHLWAEMTRILAKNGKLILNVPFCYVIHERPHDYYRYTEFALKKFVADAKLALVEFQAIGGSPEVLADFLAKHGQFIPLIGKPFAICIQSVVSAFVKTKIGKKLSRKTSEAFPLGYFLVAKK